MRLLKIILLSLGILATGTPVYSDLVVVVAKSSEIPQLSQREVQRIFLAKTRYASNGQRLEPYELSNDDYKSYFYKQISGKDLSQLNSYWTTLIFTGKGKPPKSVGHRNSLLDKLLRNPKAISYIPEEYLDDRFKVVHTLHKSK